ncbi:MAG: glycogen synthase [Chlamydiales bacterium]|nr:glycogen synthase [Chlamydiales bacterium]
MDIVHIASELAPIAKVGGLGDVLQGLSRALLSKGHQVEIILPKYDALDLNSVSDLEFGTSFGEFSTWKGIVDSLPVTLIESQDPNELFDRGTIYGCSDDPVRFAFFCRAALDYLRDSGRRPDVIHLHDWHTAVAAPLIKKKYPELEARIVFTIHNLAYQGHCGEEIFEDLGWKSAKIKDGDSYNLMKAGLLFSDYVTTVSPTYAQEILTTEMGGGLQPLFKSLQNRFSGVLNGIDYAYWDPAKDSLLVERFSLRRLAGKERVKKELRKRLSLADEECPLVVAITRLVPQKGPELIKAALLRTLEWGGQFVLLGSALDEKTHGQFYNLKRKLTGSHHVHLELSYNEELSHLVFGGGDLFLIPSIFEPCGLTQMIAMRYGTVPLVRETGGLADTVFDGKNGFTFTQPTAEAIGEAIDRALPLWNTPKWQKLVEAGMKGDYSWDKPAENYLKIYKAKS